ncbi:MAG: hypothetical protein JSV51_01425 [Candidatus Bathyarchaeota archaeon]|nr:MAG: hypothetical protein JSV51_01425 [Candidatus Bathyarchaeota archaeon]
MSDAKPNTEEILHRLSDVLDILKRISEDLQDISESLKTTKLTKAPTTTTIAEPPTQVARTTRKGVEDIKMMFTKELEAMLIFEEKEDFIKVKPRQYLGSDNFSKIASTIREAGGEYISAGKDSHFRIPK